MSGDGHPVTKLGSAGGTGVGTDLAAGGHSSSGERVDGDIVLGPLELELACERAAQLVCQRDMGCCAARGFQVDERQCMRLALLDSSVGDFPSSFCETHSVLADMRDAHTYYDPVAAGECLNEMSRSSQGCAMLRSDDPAYARVTRACDAVYNGPRSSPPGPGEDCDDHCAAPTGMASECVRYAEQSNVCGPAVAARALGQACGAGCAQGLVCIPGDRCEKPQPDGASCHSSDQCSIRGIYRNEAGITPGKWHIASARKFTRISDTKQR